MRRLFVVIARLLAVVVLCGGFAAEAQRHSFGSAPPTAPVPVPPKSVTQPARPPATSLAAAHSGAGVAPGPVAPVSSGLGAIQFLPANSPVPAPQTLTRQLFAEDERARVGALASLGVPAEYLAHGRVPFPHSIQLDLAQLSHTDDLDALLTVELDQHIVTAVMVPEGSNWRRVATLNFASSFSTGTTTPTSFVRPLRAWVEPNRYRAVFHATVNAPNGDFTENEADLWIVNGRATVAISFVSGAKQCDATGQVRPPHQSCELTQRWLESDATDPSHHLTLVTGIGHTAAHEASDLLANSRSYRLTRLRTFACQPFTYLEGGGRFEPTSNSAPCPGHEAGAPAHADHPGAEHTAGDHGTDHGEHAAADKGNADRAGTAEKTTAEHTPVDHSEHP